MLPYNLEAYKVGYLSYVEQHLEWTAKSLIAFQKKCVPWNIQQCSHKFTDVALDNNKKFRCFSINIGRRLWQEKAMFNNICTGKLSDSSQSYAINSLLIFKQTIWNSVICKIPLTQS